MGLLGFPFFLLGFDFEPELFDNLIHPDQIAVIKPNLFKKEEWTPSFIFFNEDESCIDFISKKDPNQVLQLRFIDSFVFYDKDQDIHEDLLFYTANYIFENPNLDDIEYEILSGSSKDMYVKWVLKNPHKGFLAQCGYSRIRLTHAGVHVLSLISLDPSLDKDRLMDPYEAFYEDATFLDVIEPDEKSFSLCSLEKDPIFLPEIFMDFVMMQGQIDIDQAYYLTFKKWLKKEKAEASLGVNGFKKSEEDFLDLAEQIDDIKIQLYKAYKGKVSVDVIKKDNPVVILYKNKDISGFCIFYLMEKGDWMYRTWLWYTTHQYNPIELDYYLAKVKEIEFFKKTEPDSKF